MTRAAVDPFVQHCGVTYVDECRDNKQVLLDYMGWLRKQPVPVRKRSDGSSSNNPKRTLANRVSDVRIFLKSLGISKLLAKHEKPTYHEKKVVAHVDDELSVLYGAADAEETFLLDFFIGSMARDHEAYSCRYRDLTGTTLTLYGKPDKTTCSFPTAMGTPTSTFCVIFKLSLREQGRSLRLSRTSCARLERADGILRTSRSRR